MYLQAITTVLILEILTPVMIMYLEFRLPNASEYFSFDMFFVSQIIPASLEILDIG
jgi:hypothetical protein